MKKFLSLDFIPLSPDLGLLLLRLFLGATMLWLHGWEKLMSLFNGGSATFPDPLGIGHTTSLVLAVFAEVLCSALLVLGLFTRLAALALIVTMAVAFFMVNGASLKNGELAFIYLGGYLALFFTGAGRFGFDQK